MTVKSILDQKGRDVVTLVPSDLIQKAVKELATRRIGALVVTGDQEQILGIVSERDIVRVLDQVGPDVLNDEVATIMTKSVITCREDQTIPRVMELMTHGRFRHIPVVDENGKLGGIISIVDVVRRRIEDMEKEAEDVKAYINM